MDKTPSFHASLVLRSVILVVVLSGLAGTLLIAGITRYIEPTVQESLSKRLGELVKTVENTARIACYLGDTSLATEVAKGLLMSRDVERVVIINEHGVLADFERSATTATHAATGGIAQSSAAQAYPPGTLIRELSSPFQTDSRVGKIIVVRNQASIDAQVGEAVDYIRLLIILQTAAIILIVTTISVGYIAHPIRQTATRLNALSVMDGEKLKVPGGHKADEIGRLVGNVNALIDKQVSGLMTERELRLEREIEEKRFRAIFENAETGIFVINRNGLLLSFNPAFSRAMCLNCGQAKEPVESVAGTQPSLLDQLGTQAAEVRTLIASCLQDRQSKSIELALCDCGENPRWFNMILNPVEDDLIQGVINDITESRLREAHANKLALTDPLTGLGNRLGFEHQIDQLISECRLDAERNFTLMFIDLDRFKEVNDSFGHDVGDAVLVHVARHIEHSIRKSDYAARLGGDEFVILFPFVTDKAVITRLARSLISNISKPVVTAAGVRAVVGASIGIALVEHGDLRREDIIKRADTALYAVKQSGRNDFRIHDGNDAVQIDG
ncbi:putative GGDEF domain protein [Sterolibacterium denitrificans]|uniref:GGDEF domain protein n=1 Tax=Sterolibacterium denitrificans TaxID=157592 RepID=A0A7Z7HQJ3_9PROT|nr:sensor domain-containing diguanylate cyclase [Sterolibacterium denitrificans]SMB25286.1 putative GGDEF domain protein [Sterolibacterium denitrificans]